MKPLPCAYFNRLYIGVDEHYEELKARHEQILQDSMLMYAARDQGVAAEHLEITNLTLTEKFFDVAEFPSTTAGETEFTEEPCDREHANAVVILVEAIIDRKKKKEAADERG